MTPAVAPTIADHGAARIVLEDVGKSYRNHTASLEAVRDVSLEIAAGDVFGIIGKSGAGKSTLLRLINLLERPDRGRVWVGERDLLALDRRGLRRARQSIGMIFQQFNLLQNATVFDNVAFPLRIHGLAGSAVSARVRAVLEFVALSDKHANYPAPLSGGQKQRVAIARALAGHPTVLLCDEPTSALDPETTRAVLSVLRDINQRLGVTIVIVTHELPIVRSLCRHVAVMEAGRILESFAVGSAGGARITALARELGEEPVQAVDV